MKPVSVDDETLVAYLDGELPGEQANLIENEIRANVEVRQRVDSLRATWDLLMELPVETKPSRDIAQSTIEMIALEIDQKQSSRWSRLRQNRWVLIGAFSVMLLAIGLMGGRIVSGIRSNQFLQDLPTIVDLSSLRNIETGDVVSDVEWIAKLREIKNLSEVDTPGKQRQIGTGPVPLTLSDRKQWCDQLAEHQRALLLTNYKDFERIPEEQRDKLRALSEFVYADPTTAAQSLNAVRAYSALLEEESGKTKSNIKRMDNEERFVEIQRKVNLQMGKKYAELMPQSDRREIESWWEDDLIFSLYYETVLFWELYRDAEESAIQTSKIEELIDRLSPEAQELYYDIDPADRRSTVALWVYFVIDPNMEVVPVEKLREEFGRMVDQQDLLELLPEDDARDILKRRLRPNAMEEAKSIPAPLE